MALHRTWKFWEEERFWSFVQIGGDDECWLWTAGQQGSGYGLITYNGRSTTAHRVAYVIANWIVEDGQVVLHACDTPLCCNPRHLSAGAHQENMQDMRRKGRGFDFPIRRGQEHPRSKLKAEQVAEIRRLYATGNFSQQALAFRFGVVQNHISRLVRGGHNFFAGDVGRNTIKRKRLTAKQRDRIRAEYAKGKLTQTAIAEKYGISQVAVSKIVRGEID